MFSVRLVTADSYQAQPLPQLDATFSEFRGSEIKNVPVIRIFGTTSAGEKTCLHIHGVFPYLYVPFTGEEDPTSLAYRLSASLDAAINVSLGSATSKTQHVYSIQRVSGIPFYGYHRKEHQYLKIYFYNPVMMKRAADLLQNGSVLNQSLQPHEAHIPYLLQFMIDYNVYGMSLVNLNSVKHRRLTQTLADVTSSGQSVASSNSEIDYLPPMIERQSTCELEVDALASDIMNRREVETDLELNPGLAAIWEEERARRAQSGLQGGDSQLVDPKSPPRPTFHPTDNDIYQEQRLARRLLAIPQSDESSLLTTINKSVAYAAEIQEGENLVNSTHLLSQFAGRDSRNLHATLPDSATEIISQRITSECSILETDDIPLIDLLVQLADAGVENQRTVDLDSLLGSQESEFINDEKGENADDDDDEAVDLNLTSLQLNCLSCNKSIAAEQANGPSRTSQNSLGTMYLSPLLSSFDNSDSSRSTNDEKTEKPFVIPQYDGAGDVSPTLLNSEDEDNTRNSKELSHLPEYNGNCEVVSKSRKYDDDEQCRKTPSNEENEKNTIERRNSPMPVDIANEVSALLPSLTSDAYMTQYNGFSYEPFDRLLGISPAFVPDLDSMHSSMEIGILISSAESDSLESVGEIAEDSSTIPLETVLNGDPCFTESAELDKSDVTELRDQYASLLGNSLLPDVHNNLRIDNDLGNSSNFSNSDYQTNEKPCEVLVNVRSARSSSTSRENFSSSENVAPNIQEPEAKACTRSKLGADYALDKLSKDDKDFIRTSNDNSDYNCNVVATWAELQNLQVIEKERIGGRLARSRVREPRRSRRRPSRRSDERAVSQILRLDCQTIPNGTPTSASLQPSYNLSLTPGKVFTGIETKATNERSTDSPPSLVVTAETIVETTKKECTFDKGNIVEKTNFEAPRSPDVLNQPKIGSQQWFPNFDACARLDSIDRSILDCDSRPTDANDLFPIYCSAGKGESVPANADLEESPESWLEQFDEPLRTKETPEGSSYCSSQRSQRDYTIDGFEHRHCQLTKYNKIIQDEVFTSEQVWVIEKAKVGRTSKGRPDPGICNSGDCSFPIVPIVPLQKNAGMTDDNVILVDHSENIEIPSLAIDAKTPELGEMTIIPSAADTPVKKFVLPKKRAIARRSRVRKKRIDSFSSNSSVDVSSLTLISHGAEKESDSINEAIDAVINGTAEEPNDVESGECAQPEGHSSLVEERLDGGKLGHIPYGATTRYSRVKRLMARNPEKMVSSRTPRVTRNGLRRRSSRTLGREEDDLPGIPGIPGINEYRSNFSQCRPIIDPFTCYNGVTGDDNKPIETVRKEKSQVQSVLLANWEFERELPNHGPNGLTTFVENGAISDNRKISIPPDRSTINCSQFGSAPVSSVPKKIHSSQVRSDDSSHSPNRLLTPNILSPEIFGSNDDKLPEYVALNLMMQEVRCRNTLAKLKILVEQRNTDKSKILPENVATATPMTTKDPKLSSDLMPADETKDIIEHEDIRLQDKQVADRFPEPSFETFTIQDGETSRISCGLNSGDVTDGTNIFATSDLNADICDTENVETSRTFENELDMLENEVPSSNPVEKLSNEGKDRSYQNDQFGNVIVDADFFAGNHYTIDAVSLEMPACLFEEDSDSVDKRPLIQLSYNTSASSNDSQNAQDAHSDISSDPRDLDVYDVESLTPSSSLVGFDGSSFDISEGTQSSIIDSSADSGAYSPDNCCEQSQGHSKSEGIDGSSFEETSPAFEALSPSPRICNLPESLDEEFIVDSTVEMTKGQQKINNSLVSENNDYHGKIGAGNVDGEDENSQLDHEIQDLVSQVVVRFENETNVPPSGRESPEMTKRIADKNTVANIEGESLIIDISPPHISGKSGAIIAARSKNGSFKRTDGLERLSIGAEEKRQQLSQHKRMSSPGLTETETNEKLKPPADEQTAFSNENKSEKGTIFAIIKNTQQPSVIESEMKLPQVRTRDSELMKRRLELRNESLQSPASLAEKKNDNDENHTSDDIDRCILENEDLANISTDGVSTKTLRLRPVSIKLVNVDSSQFEGLSAKNATAIESVCQIVGDNEAEPFIDENSLESTSYPITDVNIEKVIPLEFRMKETAVPENTAIEYSKEIIIAESGLAHKMSVGSVTSNKMIPTASTTLIESFDSGGTRVKPVPMIKVMQMKDARRRTRKLFNGSGQRKRRCMRRYADNTREKPSQRGNLYLTAAESQLPPEENSQVGTGDDTHGTKETEELSSHIAPILDGTVSAVFANDHLSVNLPVAQPLTFPAIDQHRPNMTEHCLPHESSSRESPTKGSDADNCLETVQLKTIADENASPEIKWRRKCHGRKSLQENSREPSPEIRASTSENSSAEELSRIIMDENIKPTIPHCYSDIKRGANGRSIQPGKMKRLTVLHRKLLRKLPPQKPTKIPLDSKPSVQQIAPNKTDQENTCSLYDRLSSRKLTVTNGRANNSDSARESKSLDVQKNLPKSDLVSHLIDEDNINLNCLTTTEQRDRDTNIPQANVRIPQSTESIEKSEKSTDNSSKENDQPTKLFPAEMAKENTDDNIVLDVANIEFNAQQRVSESSSSEEEKFLNVIEPIPVISESFVIKNADTAQRRIRTTAKRRRCRGRRLTPRNQKPCLRNGSRRVVNADCEEFDFSPLKILKESIKSFVGSKRRHCSRKLPEPVVEVSCPEAKPVQDGTAGFLLSENMVEAKNCTDVQISQLNVQHNTLPEKSVQEFTHHISQQVQLSSRKIVAPRIAAEIRVKATRKGGRRKVSEPNAEEPRSLYSREKEAPNTDEKNYYHRSKAFANMAIAELHDADSSTKESVEGSDLMLQNVGEESIESKTRVKITKRGRPRNVVSSRMRKAPAKRVSLIDEEYQATDATNRKIRKRPKLSQKSKQKESQHNIFFNPKTSDQTVSKQYPTSMSSTEKIPRCTEKNIFKDSANKINKENEKSNPPSNVSLQQISAEQKHDDDDCSLNDLLSSKRNRKVSVGNKKIGNSRRRQVIRNVEVKVYPDVNSTLTESGMDEESDVSLEARYISLKNQKAFSLSKSSLIETSQTIAEKDFRGKDASTTSTGGGIVEANNSVEMEKPRSLRKKPRNKARTSALKFKPSLYDNNQNGNVDCKKSVSLRQAIGGRNIELITAAKSQSSFAKNPGLKIHEGSTDRNCESAICAPEAIEKTPAIFRRRGRSRKNTRFNYRITATAVHEPVFEEATKEVEPSTAKHGEIKAPVTFDDKFYTDNNTESNSQCICSKNDDHGVAEETRRERKILSTIITERDTALHVVSRDRGHLGKRKKLSKNQKLPLEQKDLNDAETTVVQEFRRLQDKITETPANAESVDGKKEYRRRTISDTIADATTQESTPSTESINQKDNILNIKPVEADELSQQSTSKSGKMNTKIVQRSSSGIELLPQYDEEGKIHLDGKLVQTEPVYAKKKSRNSKISSSINDKMPQQSTSFADGINEKMMRITFRGTELPSKGHKKDTTETKTQVIIKRRGRPPKNQQKATKPPAEDICLDIVPIITGDSVESKDLSWSKMRTRAENILEAKLGITESSAELVQVQDSVETLTKTNPLLREVAQEIQDNQVPARLRKRVNYDMNSIRPCTVNIRPFETVERLKIVESPPNKYRKYSATAVNDESSRTNMMGQKNMRRFRKVCKITSPRTVNPVRDLSTLANIENQREKQNHSGRNKNGVVEKSEFSVSASNNASFDLSSLQGGLMKQRRHYNIREFPPEPTAKIDAPERTIPIADVLSLMATSSTDSAMITTTKNIEFSRNFTLCPPDSTSATRRSEVGPRLVGLVQLQQPNIILKRLSRDTLKTYGIEFNDKNKIFVKFFNKRHPDYDYRVPAYDGPADFSSSDEDDNPTDVTIAKEETRVCVYHSVKKRTNTKRETIVITPGKRKLMEDTGTVSPTNKHRGLATPGTSSKMSYCPPNRTSMLRSPGRGSGYYPPLQIIVTSPKVRRETSESRAIDVRLENRDAPSCTGACLTPRPKNDQRLHENLLRGRISSIKLPKSDRGDKRTSVTTGGSQRAGELDEIKCSEHEEMNVLKTATTTSKCSTAIGIRNLTTMLRDGKDVRKKLVFSTTGDETPDPEVNDQSLNLRTINTSVAHCSTMNEARKPLEVLEKPATRKTLSLDPQPGPSRSDDHSVEENLQMYNVTTDEESEDDNGCNVTFTQYIDSQMEKHQVMTLDRREIAEESHEIVSLRPYFDPPKRQQILETMEAYGIPKYRNQEPFFSDEADVPKQKELAQKMLKVPGKGLKDVPPFVSSVEGVTGLERWRRMKINEFYPGLGKLKGTSAIRTLVGEDFVSLTPLVKPPTREDAEKWLRAREYLENKKNQQKLVKKAEDAQNMKIQRQMVETEEDDGESTESDPSVVEASPEKTVASKNIEKILNYTLKLKLDERRLRKNSEVFRKGKLVSSVGERANDSLKNSRVGEEPTATQNSNTNDIDPSLLSVLEKPQLFQNQESSRRLGVSYGQIEFLSDSTRSNVANENLQNAKALTRYQYLTMMCLEVHVTTRGDLLPDAQRDPIAAIFYSVQSDVPPTSSIKPLEHGVIVLADDEKAKNKMHYSYASNLPWSVWFANNEEALLNVLISLITRIDPEILIGWELESLSWGYVFQRASRLGMDLSKRISRIPATQCKWETAVPDIETVADVKLPGRIVLDIWRIMRHEAALLSYTFESVIHHVLSERVPCPSFEILTDWWNLERPRASRWRVVEHYSIRVLGIFRILDQLDIIGRTSELARLFGIQFYEVFSRGSQYRVESVMLRLAKPLNYIAVSPTPLQRASMRAMEALPLILEPESVFYTDPLIVLDFQSLYPSIIIAHNYCFSTCLGRVEHIGQPEPFEFGAYTLRVPKSTSLKLQGKMNFAPCGVAFVKPEIRLGILPRMLMEILETRFMVKKAMKDHKQSDKTLQRALHSRQHGLKFLANVTYGYTAANFSGRMPCIEVGDSVISKSKETLERAIKLVESTPKWGARVVYGDTDSLFILVPGKSKADAFVIGNEIADAVTASNPAPIKLKFEKVMYPSILQTKKRYCGYMYETPDQQTPTYLAKGIETVRRDGCPAVSKILEKTLKILFDTKDLSLVKKYVTRQLDKVLRGKVSIEDLTFAKEFRGLKGYKARACVPALELTRRLMRKDPRAVPRNSERVRYVVVAGAPNQTLINCVRTPWELINDPGLRPNALYYVTRVIIPPLNRCLHLLGVDVNAWYRDMPHRRILDNPVCQPVNKHKLTIFQYFGTIVCVSCGQPSSKGICTECLAHSEETLVVLHEKLRWLHRTYDQVTTICQSCVGQADISSCSSLDCPVLYRRANARRELSQAMHLQSIITSGNNLEF